MSKKRRKTRAKEHEEAHIESIRQVIQNTVNEVRRKVAVSRPPADLSPPAHINQRCTMKPMESKMSEIKTVTYEAKVYQIGSVYEFSDKGKEWALDELIYIDEGKDLPFCTRQYEWELIREASYSIGTITPSPIELIDGSAYMFDEQEPYSNRNCIGIYEKHGHKFHLKNYATLVKVCTNIKPMAVVETLKGNGE